MTFRRPIELITQITSLEFFSCGRADAIIPRKVPVAVVVYRLIVRIVVLAIRQASVTEVPRLHSLRVLCELGHFVLLKLLLVILKTS